MRTARDPTGTFRSVTGVTPTAAPFTYTRPPCGVELTTSEPRNCDGTSSVACGCTLAGSGRGTALAATGLLSGATAVLGAAATGGTAAAVRAGAAVARTAGGAGTGRTLARTVEGAWGVDGDATVCSLRVDVLA